MSIRNKALSTGAFFVCIHVLVASAVAASASLAHKSRTPAHADKALTLVQANARVQSRTSYDPKTHPPLMYVSEGCDGSTATLQHATRILSLHGINAEDPEKNREALIPDGNPYFKDDVGIMDSLKMMKQNLANSGKVLLFKSILHRDMSATVSQHMVDMGTLAVYVTRKNPLDQLVCMIRDCWLTNEKYGFPADSSGKPTNLCFERRDPDNWGNDIAEANKAFLNVTVHYPSHARAMLDENLDRMQDVTGSGYKELIKAGYRGPRIAYEDIMAFENGGEKNIGTSLEEWKKLLKAWGVAPQPGLVMQYLESHAGSYTKHSHRDTIYNYDEVKKELQRLHRDDLLGDE